MKTISGLVVLIAVALCAQSVLAQVFPVRPIVLICPWPPGGSSDVPMRLLAKAAEKHLGQNVVIENRAGATGTLGAAAVARANPDGYLLSQSLNSVLRQPFLVDTAYDAAKDFTYIIGVSEFPFGLVVRADSPWKTLQDFIAFAQRNPGEINIAVPGLGSPGHYIMDTLSAQLNIRWTIVPYKGTVDSMNGLMGGHVSAAAESTGWAPFVDGGKARLLAVFTARRLKKYPDVPTLRDLGYDLVDRSPWGIVGPRGMDPVIVRKLHDAFHKAMNDRDFIAMLANFSQEPQYMSSDEYFAFALDMIPKQKNLVEKYGLRAQ
jgi:tripartite-type tricarboxylate transporter receptor subunit TctC